jgi:long-chain acyl-CoA synthetase
MSPDPVLTVASGTVVDSFVQRARMTPDRAAFCVCGTDGVWIPVDWATCAARISKLAAAFLDAGIGRGDRVAICAGTSLGWELAQMAALHAGACVVGLDANYPDAALARLLGDCRPRALIAQNGALLARFPPDVLRGFALVATVENAPPESTPSVPSLADLERDAPPVAPPVLARPADEALVVYSSGTTGTPKAVAYRHEQLAVALQAILDAFPDIDPQSRLLCWLPLANLFQRMIDFAAMIRGATTWIVEDPRMVMEHVAAANPRVLIGVPRFFEKLRAGMVDRIAATSPLARVAARHAIALGERRARALRGAGRPSLATRALWPLADRLALARMRGAFGSDLRYFISGSAPMPRWLLEWFEAIGTPVLEAYGVSENIVPMATNRNGERRLGSVGKPMHVHEIKLADDGEILVRGPGVAASAQLLAEPADCAGFLATGDLGAFDEDGFLWITGRKADRFKTSTGQWVNPADVEGRLARLPAVEHAVVMGAGRKAVVALLALGASRSDLLAKKDPADAAATRRAHLRLYGEVTEAVADLPIHLRPAGLLLVPAAAFSIAGGELTTNLKVRRAHVEHRFAAAIDELYRAVERATPSHPAIVVASEVPSEP